MATGIGYKLPLGANESSPPPALPGLATDKNTGAKPLRKTAVPLVLLVEDNSSDVYIISKVLKECGTPIDLRVAADGEQALAILRSFEDLAKSDRPSVILLDWNLPRISGAEVLAYARRSEHWRNVPIAVVTSTNSPVDVREINRLGATAHFRKPTDLDAYLDLRQIVLGMLPDSPLAS